MEKMIRTLMSNPPMALGAAAVAIAALTLIIWVMRGDDDDDKSSRSCRAAWVLFLVGALYVNRDYIMQGRSAATNYGTEEFMTKVRSYYEPVHFYV
jgi:hypothetical protein